MDSWTVKELLVWFLVPSAMGMFAFLYKKSRDNCENLTKCINALNEFKITTLKRIDDVRLETSTNYVKVEELKEFYKKFDMVYDAIVRNKLDK